MIDWYSFINDGTQSVGANGYRSQRLSAYIKKTGLPVRAASADRHLFASRIKPYQQMYVCIEKASSSRL